MLLLLNYIFLAAGFQVASVVDGEQSRCQASWCFYRGAFRSTRRYNARTGCVGARPVYPLTWLAGLCPCSPPSVDLFSKCEQLECTTLGKSSAAEHSRHRRVSTYQVSLLYGAVAHCTVKEVRTARHAATAHHGVDSHHITCPGYPVLETAICLR